MELPVVVSEIGGTAEGVWHAETGFLVKLDDIDQLAARIHEILRSDELRCKMGLAARAFVEQRFGRVALAERHEELYAETCQARRKPVPGTGDPRVRRESFGVGR
jgi:glycosyltransferase involved in cell wall biosynthesis